jgi:hypothetical protein
MHPVERKRLLSHAFRHGYSVAAFAACAGKVKMKALPDQLHNGAPGVKTESYTWMFPGSPIRIELDLDVVARLESVIATAHKNGDESEFGGVLLGNFRSPSTVEVTDYLLIEADPGCEATYIADELELERICSGRDSKHAGRVIGYFRTQSEPDLRYRNEEFETIQRHFNDLKQVVLLINTGSEQRTGGFLFWDSGALTPFSFLEFPFSAGVLRDEANSYADTPAAPKPQVIAPPKPVHPLGGRFTRTMLAAVLIVLVCLGAFFAYKIRAKAAAVPKPTPSVVEPPPVQVVYSAEPLELEVEGQGNGLNVHWNPKSKTVVNAREGRLRILENGDTRVIPLNAQQLTRGHVYYQPSADQVEFTLEVVDESGGSTEEFVLALSSKTNRSVQSIPLTRPAADRGAEAKNAPANTPARPAPKVFKLPPSRQTAQTAATAVIQDAPPSMPADGGSSSNPLPADRFGTQLRPVAPVPVQTARNPTPAPQIPPPVRVAPPYQPAVARKKTSPVLPASMAARFPATGRVEVALQVHVDETGRVVKAEAVPGAQKTTLDRELEEMAIDAAMRWHFDPARLGGSPVASDQGITFVFERGSAGGGQ